MIVNKTEKNHFLGITDGLAGEGQISYLNHAKVGGSGEAMAEVIIQTIDDTNSRQSVLSLKSDNTAANTSPNIGAHCLVEKCLGRPVQRNYCLNHMAERPFRNLLEKHDGKTVGPMGTNGPIGKAMRELEKHQGPFVDFERIENNLPADLDISALPEDLKFLCTFVHFIATGDIPEHYVSKDPPPHNNARWRNDCTRCLSLYCRTAHPEDYPGLKELVILICKCYAPMVIDVYFQPQLVNGSVHIFNSLERSQACLSPDIYAFVNEHFLINGDTSII